MFEMNKTKQNDLDYNIISAKEPNSIYSEQYRKMRTNIEFSSVDKEYKVINLTSTFSGEGKTVTCLNLATVYAQSEMRTLLIDMDLRKPKIHRGFNLINKQGLFELVTGENSREECVQKVSEYLHVLPTGKKAPFPAEFLMSKKVEKLIRELSKEYDRIIIDTPPMTAVTDASIISKFTDGTVLVVASRKTKVDSAQTIVKQLTENGANMIGSVLTRVRKKDHRYLNYYYYSEE